jgi:hypothetical protein
MDFFHSANICMSELDCEGEDDKLEVVVVVVEGDEGAGISDFEELGL